MCVILTQARQYCTKCNNFAPTELHLYILSHVPFNSNDTAFDPFVQLFYVLQTFILYKFSPLIYTDLTNYVSTTFMLAYSINNDLP